MVTIRAAVQADILAVVPLFVAFRDHLGLTTPAEPTFHRALDSLLEDPAALLLLADDDDARTLEGFLVLRFRYSLWVDAPEGQVDDLFVRAEARRRGIGRALLSASIDSARSRGAKLLSVATNERNASALSLYEAFGFSAARGRWAGGRQLWLELDL